MVVTSDPGASPTPTAAAWSIDDELVSFAGRPMTSVNQYKNVLGIYPRGWRLPLAYRRDNEQARRSWSG